MKARVVDGVVIDERDAVAFPDVIAAGAEFRIVGEQPDALIQLVEIRVGLIRVPLLEGVSPNADQVAFRPGGYMDRPRSSAPPCPPPRLALDRAHVEPAGVAAVLALDQGLAQRPDLLLVLLKKAQAGVDDLAGRALAAAFDPTAA